MAKNSRVQLWNGEKSPVAQLTEDLKLLQAETMKTTVITEKWAEVLESVQATAKKTTVSGGKGDLDAVKRANEEHAKAVSLFKKEQIARKELEKSAKDLEKMRLEEIRLMKAREKAFDDYEKKAQKEAVQAEKQNSLYAKVDQKLSNMVKSYRDLAVRQNLGLKLTKDEQREMERLSRLITKYDQALKMTDASSGKHQRNVGNYKSAFDGLGFSVTQLTREMPAFANSMQTGFMAISNNLPMFFDELMRLKQANVELAKSGQPTVNVFKRLGQSLVSTQSLLSIGVTLLTLFGAKMIDMIFNTEAYNKKLEQQKKHNEMINKMREHGAELIADETNKTLNLLTKLTLLNKNNAERGKIINELNSKYGFHLKNLKDEFLFQSMINQAILDYMDYSKAKIKLQLNEEYRKNLLKEEMKLTAKVYDDARKNEYKLRADKQKTLDMQLAIGKITKADYDKEMNRKFNLEKSLEEVVHNGNMLQAKDLEKINELRQKYQQATGDYIKTEDYLKKFSFNNSEIKQGSIKSENKLLKEQIDLNNELLQILQEINVIYQERSTKPIQDRIENEMVRQRDNIRENAQFETDTLDRLIEEETRKRIENATQRATFEKSMLIQGLEDQKDAKLKEGQSKVQVDLWYQQQKELMNAKLLKIDLELTDEVVQINQEQNDKLSELNDELISDMESKAQQSNEKIAEARRIGAEKEAKYFKLGLIKMQKTDEEIKQAMLENDIRKLEEEIANRKQYNLETVDLELQLYDLQKQIQDKKLADEKRLQQQLTELRKKSIEQLIQMELDKSKRVEESINKEIDKNKELQNSLKEQANAGVDTAKQSLAQLQEAEIEANKKKQAEQKKQESLEKIKIAYGILEQFIAKGDNVASATAKTNASMSIIEAFLNGFKKYFHGTDDTGNGSPISDQYGKITGVTHENEQVWSKKDRSEVGFMSREEIKKRVLLANAVIANPSLYHSGISDKAVNLTLDTGLNQDNKILASKLDRVISVLENQPSQTISEEVIDGIGRAVVATYKRGNDKLTKTYS